MGNRLLVLRHCPEVCWKPATPPGEKVQRHGIDMDTVDSDAESEVRVATKVTSPDPPQSDWVQLQDLATNKPYYFNRITKETTWQMPREFAHAVQKAQKSKENQGDWVEAQTKDGRVYWYDRVSRQTSWGKPAALVALTRRSTKFARKKMSRRKKASSQLPLETDSKPAIKLTKNNSPRVQLLNTTVETLSQEVPDGNAERSAAPVSPSKSSSSQGTLTELDLEECLEDCDTNNEYSEKRSTGSITPPFSSLTTLSNVEHKTSDKDSNEEMKEEEVVVSHEDNKAEPRETIEIEKNDAVKQTQEEESKEEDAVEAKGKRTRKKKKNKKKSAGMENTTQHGTELVTT